MQNIQLRLEVIELPAYMRDFLVSQYNDLHDRLTAARSIVHLTSTTTNTLAETSSDKNDETWIMSQACHDAAVAEMRAQVSNLLDRC